MNLNHNVKMTGQLTIKKFDATGKLIQVSEHKNLVVTTGKNYIAARMANNSTNLMSHMAIGTSDVAPAVVDTTLAVQAGINILGSTTPTANTVTYTASFPAGTGTGALVEAGIFNSAAAGLMLCRTVFPVVNKGPSDTISITWVVTVS